MSGLGPATARNIIYHWENFGLQDEFHVAILREMKVWPSACERENRERHDYLIDLVKKTYEAANYSKFRRQWLELHSLPRGTRLRNLLASAEPRGYRTKGNEGDGNALYEGPKRRQIPESEITQLIQETLEDPAERWFYFVEQIKKQTSDKASQTDEF